MTYSYPLTWTCHVCGENRPDAEISVFKSTRMVKTVEVHQNVRYCNDRASCTIGAKDVDFVGGRPIDSGDGRTGSPG